ncbi:RNA methyltransferase [Sulfodiicoccus acidiphilus]|uniref:tRNA (guanine(10)-N(2))-dimethyltransferase n=1 Tax=Sulfodiicoccus acidiphilus TaxID=1670455 RepID=A0A348B343_9CREN|nr:TRM11 family methyltransferase [Sulfodiicoccus acidiphilus]BBD72595.1 RNA methyltransferase [Sulfodiicoccus acidiphilus]GGT93449.1 RNA methyltransferase [Sulfodiicoccus acidiphilus]
MNYARLRADNQFLALDELEALNGSPPLHHFNAVALYEGDPTVASKASFLKSSGLLLKISSDLDEALSSLRGICVSLDLDVVMGSRRDELSEVSRLSRSLSLSRRCRPADLIVSDGLFLVGLRSSSRDTKSLASHLRRPFVQSGIMNPELARALVNLSRPKRTVLDPFAGTGSLLIEAAWRGFRCVGIDAERNMLIKARANLEALDYQCLLLNGSATQIPLVHVEAIATDPPYGRSTKVWGTELRLLYQQFFLSASEVLKKGGFLSFSTDSKFDWTDDLVSTGLTPRRIHYVYSHRSLSRAIYVVEKK